MTLALGVLISGGGTTMTNLQERIQDGRLDARIVKVVSSASKAKGLERARRWGYDAEFIGRRRFEDDDAYSQAITDKMALAGVELIVLAGFLKKFNPPQAWRERVINIHPSLIPAFCGHGFYGMRVHEAVHAKGCRVTGCTVHLVNEIYDDGPIIVQRAVQLNSDDDPEDIRRKVFEAECEALPEAITLFAKQRIHFEEKRAVIVSATRD